MISKVSPIPGRALKRSTDVIFGVALTVLTAPLLLAAAVAVAIREGGPILFRQERIGRFGRPFRIVKLRTMRPAGGPLISQANDARVTRTGLVLRRWKLDELPQLWNVVSGEMSIVGPRPEVPTYVAKAPRGYRAIAALRPGLTDWASIILTDENALLTPSRVADGYYERVLLPRKLALARLYHRRQSWCLDLRLIAATGVLIFAGRTVGRALVGTHFVARARRGISPDGAGGS